MTYQTWNNEWFAEKRKKGMKSASQRDSKNTMRNDDTAAHARYMQYHYEIAWSHIRPLVIR